ncbi:MAG: hypothetical protein HC910_08835 [Spirulinaceae cyanobacterium SM2_1_0]|nr:hypothetical protein [Spirulinaceae cyanobacterium SM2_1_0]
MGRPTRLPLLLLMLTGMSPAIATPAQANTAAASEPAFKHLLRALRFSQGEFSLILADCPDAEQRCHLTHQLRERLSHRLQDVTLPISASTLLSSLQSALNHPGDPDAVMVSGLEQVEDVVAVLCAANLTRNDLRRCCPLPLVLWVTPEILRLLKRLAPDLSSWAAPVIRFA